jgi:hypothetical protein
VSVTNKEYLVGPNELVDGIDDWIKVINHENEHVNIGYDLENKMNANPWKWGASISGASSAEMATEVCRSSLKTIFSSKVADWWTNTWYPAHAAHDAAQKPTWNADVGKWNLDW